MVIYKDDMAIKSKQGLSTNDKVYVFFSVIFMIAFWAAIPLGITVKTELFWIMTVMIVYCGWSHGYNKSTKFIHGLTPLQKIYPAIAAATQVKPKVSVVIQNYHYPSTNNDSSSKRIDTHRHEHQFSIPQWMDRSAPVGTINYLEVLNMCRLRIKRDVDYSPIAKSRLESDKAMVIRNHRRDTHYDLNVNEVIDLGCSDHALVHN